MNKGVSTYGKQRHESETKTGRKGNRVVPVPPHIVGDVLDHLDEWAEPGTDGLHRIVERFGSGMLNADVLEQKVPKFVEMLQKRHAPNDWRTLLEATTAMLHGLGNGEAFDMEDLTGIEHPVLILRGELDNMVGADESENAAAFLPNGEYRELPATKHPIEQVDVAMLAEVLKEYFYTA